MHLPFRNSNPDGYTIAYMPVESTMLRALGFTDLSTDDFKFIGRAMTIPAAVTVRADAPWNTFQEFVDYAKEHPGEVQVGKLRHRFHLARGRCLY